jgi:hypothetical protein
MSYSISRVVLYTASTQLPLVILPTEGLQITWRGPWGVISWVMIYAHRTLWIRKHLDSVPWVRSHADGILSEGGGFPSTSPLVSFCTSVFSSDICSFDSFTIQLVRIKTSTFHQVMSLANPTLATNCDSHTVPSRAKASVAVSACVNLFFFSVGTPLRSNSADYPTL